jgi:IS5 family transposase
MTLFRALLLGLWYDLSDVKLEAQLARDLMFRKFCRLELDQGVPQASTIGRFRVALERSGQLGAVLNEINGQLLQANVILQEGRVAIMDTTVIEAVQSGIRKGDPDAGSQVKVNVRVKCMPNGAFRPSLTSMKVGLFLQQP